MVLPDLLPVGHFNIFYLKARRTHCIDGVVAAIPSHLLRMAYCFLNALNRSKEYLCWRFDYFQDALIKNGAWLFNPSFSAPRPCR